MGRGVLPRRPLPGLMLSFSGEAVCGADDADGGGQTQDQALVAGGFRQHDGDQHQRNQEGGKDTELSGSAWTSG